jgi:hypothetical protein
VSFFRKDRTLKVLLLILVVFLLLGAGFYYYFFIYQKPSGNISSNVALVPCTSSVDTLAQKVPGWVTLLYASSLSDATAASAGKDNGTRILSIAGIKNKTEANDMYLKISKEDGSSIAGASGLMEICDKDNMVAKYGSTADATLKPAGEIPWMMYYMHGGYYAPAPGEYRIDGYVKIDGVWYLVDRVTGITFTK